jgi:hypothetical protein
MNEGQLMMWGLGLFMLGTYAATVGLSLSSGKSIWPYAALICMHCAAGMWLWSQLAGLGRSGNDAAGKGMSAGLSWLIWAAINVALALIAIATFFVRRLRA